MLHLLRQKSVVLIHTTPYLSVKSDETIEPGMISLMTLYDPLTCPQTVFSVPSPSRQPCGQQHPLPRHLLHTVDTEVTAPAQDH